MLMQLEFPELVKRKIRQLRRDLLANVTIIDFGQSVPRLGQ